MRPLTSVSHAFRGPRHLTITVAASITLLVVVGVAAAVCSFALARSEARHDAEVRTTRLADFVVGPLLTRSLAGDLQAADELDRLVRIRLLNDNATLQVTVWRPDGTVVYSSEPRIVGQRFATTHAFDTVVSSGQPYSQVGPPDIPPGTVNESSVVEVFSPMRTAAGPLVLEAFYDQEIVAEQTRTIALPLIGLAVIPLILLQAIQLPITFSLIRRIRQGDQERADLLERALSASDRERREIAAGLHDTVVQDLAGASYAMSSLEREIPEKRKPVAGAVVETLHRSVDQLRRLMVEIYPPNLSSSGLAAAMEDLARPLRQQGVVVTTSIETLPELPEPVAAALYRAAREGLTNVAKHAQASAVCIALTGTDDGVSLVVTDDGVGAPADVLSRPTNGHMGVRLVQDRIQDLGGALDVFARPGGGTALDVRLPADISADR